MKEDHLMHLKIIVSVILSIFINAFLLLNAHQQGVKDVEMLSYIFWSIVLYLPLFTILTFKIYGWIFPDSS